MVIESTTVAIATPDGEMPAFIHTSKTSDPLPAVLLLMEAFGVTPYLQNVAARIAHEGYVVLTPDLYYRKSPHTTFSYDDVDHAMATMWQLNFGVPIEQDLNAALNYLIARPDVNAHRIGVTGFCLGGGLTFLTACRFSNKIAAAAPFYGMVLDEWIDAVTDISVPLHLFFGGTDPFISGDRIHQIEARFKELDKNYQLTVYPDATHGFFCHERSSYHAAAAQDAWCQLMNFFHTHLN